MTDDRADTAPSVDREALTGVIHAVICEYPEHIYRDVQLPRCERAADAVLAVLPTPAEYVAGLADDETLVERTVRVMYDGLDGPPPPREARVLIEASIEDVLRALAAALTERTDRG